jgi:hypothetical protein
MDTNDLQTLEQEYYKTHDSSNMAEICPNEVDLAKNHLETLSFEPAVSFLGFSDVETTLLMKTSEAFSKMDQYKHADLAIVRMYEWICLRDVSRIKNRTNIRDKTAHEFFTLVREASTT